MTGSDDNLRVQCRVQLEGEAMCDEVVNTAACRDLHGSIIDVSTSHRSATAL